MVTCSKNLTAAAAAIVLVACSGQAHAGLVSAFGTLSFTNILGTAKLTLGTALLSTSSVVIPSGTALNYGNNFILQSKASITLNGVVHANTLPVIANVTNAGGSVVTLSTTTIGPTTNNLTVTVGPLSFVYTSEVTSYTTTGQGATLTYEFLGNLTADTSSTVSTPTTSEFIIAVTQSTLGSGNVSYTANLDTPNPNAVIPVPEPISLSLLATGVLSLGLVRRRRVSLPARQEAQVRTPA